MKEKRIWKKILGFGAAICMMALMLGMTTLAANKVEGLALGTKVQNTDMDPGITHCYKFKLKKPALVVISGLTFEQYNGNVQSDYLNYSICTAKGKKIYADSVKADSSYEASQVQVFGLNKGTYQIKIKEGRIFQFIVSAKNYPDQSGKSQKKAVKLVQKRAKKGVLGLGESAKKADWFKIVLKKPAKIRLTLEASTTRPIWLDFSAGKDTKLTSIQRKPVTSHSSNGIITAEYGLRSSLSSTLKNLPKGTYYVKVYRGSKDSKINGIYEIKWR